MALLCIVYTDNHNTNPYFYKQYYQYLTTCRRLLGDLTYIENVILSPSVTTCKVKLTLQALSLYKYYITTW